MKLRIILALFIACTLATHLPAGDGWFGSSSQPAANGTTTTAKKWSMTGWLPSWPSSSKPKSNKPSMLSSMAQGTKNAWTKTVSFLNPFDNPPKPATEDKSANSAGWFGQSGVKPQEPSFSDWQKGKRPAW